MNPSAPDPSLAASLYNPLDAILDDPTANYDLALSEDTAANARKRRKELAATYGITQPSYWGQMIEKDDGTYRHTNISETNGLLRKITRVLLPGEPCCMEGGNDCQDFRCGSPGAGWGQGWATQDWVFEKNNGKCGKWGGDGDAALFPRSDGSPNRMYDKRYA